MNSRQIHLTKTVTWRIIATGTTFTLAFIFFYDERNVASKATSIAFIEIISKMALYYYHERLWHSSLQYMKAGKRHLMKTVSWRIIASTTTFILALAFFNNSHEVIEKATWIAVIESGLKMIFYYLHEKAWYRYKTMRIKA